MRDQAAPPALLDRYRAWAVRNPLLIGVGTPVNAPEPMPASQRPDQSAHVFEWSTPTTSP